MSCCIFLSSVTSFLLPDTLPRLSGHLYCSSLFTESELNVYTCLYSTTGLYTFQKMAKTILGFYVGIPAWCAVGGLVVVQMLSPVQLFATPRTAAPRLCNPMDCSTQASLSFTISWSLLKLMSIKSVIPSSHLVLCYPLLLPSIFPSIRGLSSKFTCCIRWPKYWSFSFTINLPISIQDSFPLGLTGLSPCSPRDFQESSSTPQFESI